MAPVPPNPSYVPPSFASNAVIKISLSASEPVAFLENDLTISYGQTTAKGYTKTAFGQKKTYKVNTNGKTAKNYYEVSIEKKYKTKKYWTGNNNIDNEDDDSIEDSKKKRNSSFGLNYNNQPQQQLQFGGDTKDKLETKYAEIVLVKEYELNTDGKYKLKGEKTYDLKRKGSSGLAEGYDVISLNLEFVFKTKVATRPEIPTIKNIDYKIVFDSNYSSELGERVVLSYDLVDTKNGFLVKQDKINLDDGGNDPIESIASDVLNNSTFKFRVDGNVTANYTVNGIYYTNRVVNIDKFSEIDFSKWNKVDPSFDLPGNLLTSQITVYVVFDKEIQKVIPNVSLPNNIFTTEVKDSDEDKFVTIPFNTTDADSVDVFLDNGKKFTLSSSETSITLGFRKDFDSKFGVRNVRFTANNNADKTISNTLNALINFQSIDDFPSIIQTTAPREIDIPSFSDSNIEYEVMYKATAATSVDIDLLLKDKTRVTLYKNAPTDNKIKINLKELPTKYPQWNGSDNVTLIIKPYNRGGSKELIGNEYEIKTLIKYPSIRLDETIITKAVYDAFAENLKIDEPEKESKYLTHLLSLDNGERVLISSYEEDNWTLSEKGEDDLGNQKVTKEVKSVILKLYSPLPSDVVLRDTIWITRLITNPLIETVVLNEQDEKESPFIKGPNFDVDIDFVKGQSTNYESLDNLILSSSSSTKLVQQFLSGSSITLEDLNIEYANGSISEETAEYQWENFVHFSSAEERVKNFIYKLQLIENYEDLIVSASTDFTAGGSAAWTASVSAKKEVERQQAKKSALIQGFDGFETFLYTSSSLYTTATSSSITWPYSSSVRLKTTNQEAIKWYENIIDQSIIYDVNNPNYIINNIPQYITTNPENNNFLLFFSMIGHHFDILYFYTKAIERNRGLGYKNRSGASDRLLYDYLKSFNWDAKNLGSGAQIWDYVYGEDINGNQTVSSPVKERTNEVWRRIANNLPYLLKHKGTRRGIHALMACYGIPSSNLSIIEFGGPEQTEETISKLLVEDISYALKFDTTGYIAIPWSNTNQNRKPDTIELFVKPAYSGQWGIFSDGTRFFLEISGSVNSKYGKVILTDNTANVISSSLLPIFNDRYFGIEVSRTLTGSNQITELNVLQTEKDREIFSSYSSKIYTTGSSYWNLSDDMFFGNSANEAIGYGFSGSIDEIRVWSTPLSRSRFEEHCYYPEMINGNHISSSTTDLHFRLDFEYPKNVTTTNKLINVAPTNYYSASFRRNDYEDGIVSISTMRSANPSASFSASLSGFTSVVSYPYQFELIDRKSVLEIPSLGASRYSTNKVRFSSQSLVADLSVNSRSTLKSYEYAPIDSNRVGVFVSPMKELNYDIAKSLGSNNLDDYIGDPSDLYKDSYNQLNILKNYYFERTKNRDIYEYINIIKSYEKAMFDDIKQMLPARVKPTTGLLVEPHFLERSKYKHIKPTGDEYYNETEITSDSIILVAENNQFDSIIDATEEIDVIGENNQFDSIIDATEEIDVIGENNQLDTTIDTNSEIQTYGQNNQYESIIDIGLDLRTNTEQQLENLQTNKLLDYDPYQDIGFSVYIQSGSSIRTYYDVDGTIKKERIKLFYVRELTVERRLKFNTVINGVGDFRGGFVKETNFITGSRKLVTIPFTSSLFFGAESTGPVVGDTILNVEVPDDGYLPTHYRYVGDLTTGLQNSYFRGSKNTAATTLDGSPPVESFISNPNSIRVLPGRTSTEPIIESDG